MMARQYFLYRISSKLALITVMLITVKLVAMLYQPPTLESTPLTNLSEKQFLESPFDPSLNLDIDEVASMDGKVTDEMKRIIEDLREQIKRELNSYKLPLNRDVDDLILEKGGTPIRSIVITTWRSGSTFIGGVFNSHPATFHFSEPLTDYKTVQVRAEPLAGPAVRALRSLLECNYHLLGRYLERSKSYTWLFTHNTRLWKHCSKHRDICFEPQFLSPVCRLFPFQSMKVVHLRLRLTEQLLADTKLNVRVVYLVRDPRGVLASRSTLGWCLRHDDCSSAVHVCADMVDDYSAALRLSKLYPQRFKVVRYEDISLRPDEVIPDLFKFCGLQYHPDVKEFVKVHTTQSNSNRYSTYRNSSAQALLWRRQFKHSRVEEVQQTCRVALAAWGYLPAHNASHQLSFNPLLEPFSFP